MKKKFALMLVTAAGALAMLVPATSHAAPTCVEITGPHGVHLQVGYAPNGPASCKQLP